MPPLFWIIIAWLAAFLVNLFPALMPPSWTVLAAFYITFDLPLIPLMLGAAVMGALGRLTLAALTGYFAQKLPLGTQQEVGALGRWVVRPPSWRWWSIAFGYFAGPFPSNVPFVAAGAGRVSTWRLALAFGLARMATDTAWVWSAGRVAPDALRFIEDTLLNWQSTFVQIAGLAALILMFVLPWSRWLRRR
jgi:hypothetical protein